MAFRCISQVGVMSKLKQVLSPSMYTLPVAREYVSVGSDIWASVSKTLAHLLSSATSKNFRFKASGIAVPGAFTFIGLHWNPPPSINNWSSFYEVVSDVPLKFVEDVVPIQLVTDLTRQNARKEIVLFCELNDVAF